MGHIDKDLISSYDDIKLVTFLLNHFKDSVPLKIKDLSNECNKSNLSEIKKILHALKNSFGNIGAHKVAEICQNFEDIVDHSNSNDFSIWIESLNRYYSETLSEFEQVIKDIYRNN